MEYIDLPADKSFLVSCKVLLHKEDKILLLQIGDFFPANAGKWVLTGGIINFGEQPVDALIREADEEAGLKIVEVGKPILINSVIWEKFEFRDGTIRMVHFVEIVFNAKFEDSPICLSDEHKAYRWVTVEEALSMDLTRGTRKTFEFLRNNSPLA